MPRNKYKEDETDFAGAPYAMPMQGGGFDFSNSPGEDVFGGGMDFQGVEHMPPMEMDQPMDFSEYGGPVDSYDFSDSYSDPTMGFDFGAQSPMDFSGYQGPQASFEMDPMGGMSSGYDFASSGGMDPMEIDTRQSVSNPIFGGSRGSAIGEAVEAPADMFETGRDRLADFLLRMSQQQPASPQLPSMEEVDARFRRGR
jgi:hypothetical protein